MDVRVIKNEVLTPKVGDIIEFTTPSENRDGSNFYLICQDNAESHLKSNFFLINLNGKKGREIKYYNSLTSLLNYHQGKFKLHSSILTEIALIEKDKY